LPFYHKKHLTIFGFFDFYGILLYWLHDSNAGVGKFTRTKKVSAKNL
jgi:hypothetical protein